MFNMLRGSEPKALVSKLGNFLPDHRVVYKHVLSSHAVCSLTTYTPLAVKFKRKLGKPEE